MAAEDMNNLPTEDTQPNSAQSKAGLGACIGAGVGVFALFVLASVFPWSGAIKWFTNLAWINPVLMFGAAVSCTVMFVCIACKGHDHWSKHGKIIENTAGSLAMLCGLWMLGSGIAWVGGAENIPSQSRYPDLMSLSPNEIVFDDRDGLLAWNLSKNGSYEMWTTQPDCEVIVSMSGPEMKYDLLINGKSLGQCNRGLNTLEWNYKGQ